MSEQRFGRGEGGVGLLCMAYGSPRTEADIEAYYTNIRGGRPPSPESLEELQQRYRGYTTEVKDRADRVIFTVKPTAWKVR